MTRNEEWKVTGISNILALLYRFFRESSGERNDAGIRTRSIGRARFCGVQEAVLGKCPEMCYDGAGMPDTHWIRRCQVLQNDRTKEAFA